MTPFGMHYRAPFSESSTQNDISIVLHQTLTQTLIGPDWHTEVWLLSMSFSLFFQALFLLKKKDSVKLRQHIFFVDAALQFFCCKKISWLKKNWLFTAFKVPERLSAVSPLFSFSHYAALSRWNCVRADRTLSPRVQTVTYNASMFHRSTPAM